MMIRMVESMVGLQAPSTHDITTGSIRPSGSLRRLKRRLIHLPPRESAVPFQTNFGPTAASDFAGKLTGDQKLETEGKIDRAAGKVRNTVGGLKDSLRDH